MAGSEVHFVKRMPLAPGARLIAERPLRKTARAESLAVVMPGLSLMDANSWMGSFWGVLNSGIAKKRLCTKVIRMTALVVAFEKRDVVRMLLPRAARWLG